MEIPKLRSAFLFVLLFYGIFFYCSCEYSFNSSNQYKNTDGFSLIDAPLSDEFWRYRLDENGLMVNSPDDLLKLIGGDMKLCEVTWDDSIQWVNLGPFDSKNGRQMNQGRIESISVNKLNNNDIVIGSHNGGAWRTVNGGETWDNTTDDEGLSVVGFHEITRHPRNQQILYAATGTALDKWNNGTRGYGVGIVMSEDGGTTWDFCGHSPTFGSWRSGTMDIAVDPRSTLDSTILYTINESTLFRWTGNHQAEGEWKTIYKDKQRFSGPAIFGSVGHHDIEIDRFGNVYLCNMLGVHLLPIGSDSLRLIQSIKVPDARNEPVICGEVVRENPLKNLYDLEINRSGHLGLLVNYYYAAKSGSKCSINNRPYFYYSSTDGGETWTDPVRLKTSGYALPNLAVHQYDINIFYFEGSNRQVMRSIDGGASYERLKTYRNHVDVRNLQLIGSKYGDTLGRYDELFVGNDGGIAKLHDGSEWEDITGAGIANTNYFGLDITEDDNEYVFLGAQDGSANFYRDGEWYTTSPGGDNGDCLIDPRDKLHVYQSANGTLQNGKVDSIRWRGRSVKSLLNGGQLFPLLMNPANPEEIFAGAKNLFVSSDEGKTWTKMIGPHPPKRINKIAMSKSNPNVLYYVINGFFWDTKSAASASHNQGGIFKAIRGNNNEWLIENVSSNLLTKCRGEDNCGLREVLSSVTVDPENTDRIWVTMSGFREGSKVFQSENSGATWNNVSQCLPNLPAVIIVYESGSNDGLYVGTDYGIFYKNANMDEWIYYAENGPKCMISDMAINNTSKELFVSTLGRGLWKVPVASK